MSTSIYSQLTAIEDYTSYLAKHLINQLIIKNPDNYSRMLRNCVPSFWDFFSKNYTHEKNSQNFYDYLNNTSPPICPHCKIKEVKFLTFFQGYKKFCSAKCANLYEGTKEKIKKHCLEKYGVEHHLMLPEMLEKRKKTCIKKYGVEHSLQNYDVREKGKKTCLKNYGVEHAAKTQAFHDKIRKTCNEKYGVDNVMHDPFFMHKVFEATHRWKEYQMPSGKIVKMQGYEHIALDELFKNNCDEDQIILDIFEKPQISYHNPIKNVLAKYYPDIYIKDKNLIIEVKSQYTYECNLEINIAKHEASTSAGFIHEFWICDDKRVIKIC